MLFKMFQRRRVSDYFRTPGITVLVDSVTVSQNKRALFMMSFDEYGMVKHMQCGSCSIA